MPGPQRIDIHPTGVVAALQVRASGRHVVDQGRQVSRLEVGEPDRFGRLVRIIPLHQLLVVGAVPELRLDLAAPPAPAEVEAEDRATLFCQLARDVVARGRPRVGAQVVEDDDGRRLRALIAGEVASGAKQNGG